MTTDPLLTSALLGTARSPGLPPAPDPALTDVWQAIPRENPAASLLHALALTRALHRAGLKCHPAPQTDHSACPAESRPILPPAAADSARRLLSGESPEFLPEWLESVTASGCVLPARMLPDFLTAASKNPALRPVIAHLTGERGPWLARRHPEFAWLLESTTPPDTAWETGAPAERIAWLRHTRSIDPAQTAALIASHWKSEDASLRESIIRLVAAAPHDADESWLESQALADRRQEIRESAAATLATLPGSAFRRRTLDRARAVLRIERRLLRRILAIHPPNSFDPTWATDAIREKPPQGTGEKAWWLRQIIAQTPLDDWPGLLDTDPATLFSLPIDPDWHSVLLLGWTDSAIRLPHRALPEHFLPFLAALDPWPLPQGKTMFLAQIIGAQPRSRSFPLLERHLPSLAISHAIDLLARIATPPPPGQGDKITTLIDKAIPRELAGLTRPQARALAACLPPTAIQGRLERIAQLADLPNSIEAFATALEFRKSMLSQLHPHG